MSTGFRSNLCGLPTIVVQESNMVHTEQKFIPFIPYHSDHVMADISTDHKQKSLKTYGVRKNCTIRHLGKS